jgi:uncharacterized membrane protein YdjX (TVP38/TMEM64 family)
MHPNETLTTKTDSGKNDSFTVDASHFNKQFESNVSTTTSSIEFVENPPPSSLCTPDPPRNDTVVELSQEEVRQRRRSFYFKLALATILVSFIIFVIVDSQTNQHTRNGIKAFLNWINGNPGAGVVAFILVYFAATIIFIPGSILTFGAGFVFSASFGSLGIGILLGTISVFLGASSGAIASFLLGRYIFRESVGKLSKKYTAVEALDKALVEKGFRIMVLLRLSPIIPFNVINYVAGVTAIPFWSYVLALFAIIPGTILYVFLGASAGSLAESANSGDDNMTITIIVVVVGVFFAVLAVTLTTHYARKELNKVVASRQAEAEQQQGHDEHSVLESRIEEGVAIAEDTNEEEEKMKLEVVLSLPET